MGTHHTSNFRKYTFLPIRGKQLMMEIYDVVGVETPFRLHEITKITGKPIPPGGFANLKRNHCVRKYSEIPTTRGDRPIITWIIDRDFEECIEKYKWREKLVVNTECLG